MASDEPVAFVLFGTPLEDLEKDELPSKKSVQDLTVRDEQGRQRFHGAFTGGFSAGYYNSVDTKEGWTPSTFQSSRKRKADSLQQRPEDFMDPEDLNEFGIAPRRVQTTKDFRDVSKQQSSAEDSITSKLNQAVIPGRNALLDIIKPTGQQIGVRLLMSMGWKPGQGIGPRIRKEPVNQSQKVYGCQLPPTESTEYCEEEDENCALFTFAPQDTAELPFTPKDNLNGIGYSGMTSTSLFDDKYDYANPTTTKAVFKTGKKIAIRGQAFGVGALEDDDEDIYAKDDMSQYDFLLNDSKDNDKASHKKNRARLGIKDNTNQQQHLEGFSPATKPRGNKKIYLPPKLPDSFAIQRVKIPQSILDAIAKNSPQSETSAPRPSRFLNRHFLSVEERAQLLGDKFRLPAPASLAPQTSTSTDTSSHKHPIEMVQRQSFTPVDPNEILRLSKSDGDQKFKPFAANPDKQKRYQIFLNMKKEGRTDFAMMQPQSMTEWEKEKEHEEFHRASVLFRPLSQGLSNRFVSTGSTLDESVAVTKTKEDVDHSLTKPDTTDKPLERTVTEWHPDKLLCRRFNIPNPYPDSSSVGVQGAGKKTAGSIFAFLTTADSMPKPTEKALVNPSSSSSVEPLKAVNMPSSLQFNVEINHKNTDQSRPDAEVTENTERPTIDFFKAIFLDSEEENNSDGESKTGEASGGNHSEIGEKAPMIPQLDTPTNSLQPEVVSSLSASLVDVTKGLDEIPRAPLELFGPALPPDYSKGSSVPQKDKHKSSRKKKRKKDKSSKKKKRKKSHHRSSSSSSSGSESSTDITRKLKRRLLELKKK